MLDAPAITAVVVPTKATFPSFLRVSLRPARYVPETSGILKNPLAVPLALIAEAEPAANLKL